MPYKSKKTGKVNKHYYIGYHCTKGVYFADEKGTPIAKELVEKDESCNYYYRYKSKIVYLEKRKSLYVDWNDEFKDLYDVDLVVLPKDLEVKYKLSRRSVNSPKATFTAQHNNLR